MKPTIKQKKDDPVNLDISTEESDIYEYMEHKMLKKNDLFNNRQYSKYSKFQEYQN